MKGSVVAHAVITVVALLVLWILVRPPTVAAGQSIRVRFFNASMKDPVKMKIKLTPPGGQALTYSKSVNKGEYLTTAVLPDVDEFSTVEFFVEDVRIDALTWTAAANTAAAEAFFWVDGQVGAVKGHCIVTSGPANEASEADVCDLKNQ